MLLTKLPKTVAGQTVRTDYLTWMRFGSIWEAPLLQNEKIYLSYRLIFRKSVPSDLAQVKDDLEACFRFYNCEKEPRITPTCRERVLDWKEDSPTIWADFLIYARIDLDREKDLHWWEFMALFESLPEDAQIKKRMGLRSTDLSKIKDPEMRNNYAQAKAQVALDYQGYYDDLDEPWR